MERRMSPYIPLPAALALLLALPAHAAEPAPLTVGQFMSQERIAPAMPGAVPTVELGDARPQQKFRVRAYVQSVSQCPPCPEHAKCESCSPSMIVADAPNRCPPQVDAATCPGALQVMIDYMNNYPDLAPGTQIMFEVETSRAMHTLSMLTPKSRAESEMYQKLLVETLDSQPQFKRAKRPDWLKDVPGETYEMK
jgi:hypothetical protein